MKSFLVSLLEACFLYCTFNNGRSLGEKIENLCNNKFNVEVLEEDSNIIKLKIVSINSSKDKFIVEFKYDTIPNAVNNKLISNIKIL